MTSVEDVRKATRSAVGTVVMVSANPIHDTGGGQRSAQMALEFLRRDWCVVFASDGTVTETVDLNLHYPHPRLVQTTLQGFSRLVRTGELDALTLGARILFITQVPVEECRDILVWMEGRGTRMYDCIDRWDSELGYGWYRASMERRVARSADVLVASAPALVAHVRAMTGRPVNLLPNAYNGQLFQAKGVFDRPKDLPEGPFALYVGALWGGWMDWELVAHAAHHNAGVDFVFIGDHQGEGDALPGNCRFLGLKAQTDLPAYLAHADVGILPWKSNEVSQATSPLKIYEYLAMGLPVVAPELEPLRGLPGVFSAAGADLFAEGVERLVHEGAGEATRSAMMDFARENSWQQRVDALLRWEEHAPRTRRPSTVRRFLRRLGLSARR